MFSNIGRIHETTKRAGKQPIPFRVPAANLPYWVVVVECSRSEGGRRGGGGRCSWGEKRGVSVASQVECRPGSGWCQGRRLGAARGRTRRQSGRRRVHAGSLPRNRTVADRPGTPAVPGAPLPMNQTIIVSFSAN